MADESKTEQATPRRREKAREKGQVARSRELPSALALLTVTFLVWGQAEVWKLQWRDFLAHNLLLPSDDMKAYLTLLQRTAMLAIRWGAPPLLMCWLVAAGGIAAQGGFVLAPAALEPKPEKLNPASNLGKLFSLNSLRGLLKSLLPVAYLVYLGVTLITAQWEKILRSCFLTPRAASGWIFELAFGMAWKAGLVFAIWFLFDYLLERLNFDRQLRMSRQEIREEAKETEGHPLIRSRVRRVQRQMRKRRMLKDVARASVVIINPTEYAVALEYRPEEMPAPMVVAKGRNLLAQRIKREANWRGIPVIENPPLAQALYRTVEIGQAIPAKLYAAVAEILAFIYRLQGRTHIPRTRE
ncbi:MAG: EscU/YscU/HrcU family type III secretion system export apparatus switch protein [Terriglobia bacterium]